MLASDWWYLFLLHWSRFKRNLGKRSLKNLVQHSLVLSVLYLYIKFILHALRLNELPDFVFIIYIFSFFYKNRRKYWFGGNFRLPVFDRFTRFRMSWTRFDYFCLSIWDKNFVASVARELLHGISWNFIFSITPT